MARKKSILNNGSGRFNNFYALYTHYKLLSTNLFKWENLPNVIETRYIEEALFNNGEVVFYDNSTLGYLCLPCSGQGVNIYNEPTSFHVVGVGFTDDVSATNGVEILNNSQKIPTKLFINYYVNQLIELDNSIQANVIQQKFPYIIGTTKKNELSMRNITRKVLSGDIAIYVDEELNDSGEIGMTCLNTHVPYVVDKLQKQKLEVEKMLLSLLGINCTIEKSERLLTDEINSNNIYIGMNLELMYSERLKACKAINEKFNLNITVKKVSVEVDDLYRNTLNKNLNSQKMRGE